MRRGLAASREQAQGLVAAGIVAVSGAVASKAARMVAPEEPVVLLGAGPRFVGRGGEKLDAALERFDVPVAGARALDAGASTGGFTDCLLQRGAASVTAVDVGYGQIHERLRKDPRVTVVDRTNIRRYVVDPPFALVVADLSFISLRTAAPALVGANATDGADVVVLVKPQFEAGRAEATAGRGVVRDPAVWLAVLCDTRAALVSLGAAMIDLMVSPLKGADGNVEFLAHVRAHSASPSVDDRSLARVVAQAAGHERH